MTIQPTDIPSDDLTQSRLYAWNDPLLDRKSFENRLLYEPHLAELVAKAIEETIEIRAAFAATKDRPQATVSLPSPSDRVAGRYLVNAAWATSIAVAIAVIVIPIPWISREEPRSSTHSLAQIWSDLHSQATPSSSIEPDGMLSQTDDDLSEWNLLNDEELDVDLPDWLIAATSFETSNPGAMP